MLAAQPEQICCCMYDVKTSAIRSCPPGLAKMGST
jgi:hypothetical protein